MARTTPSTHSLMHLQSLATMEEPYESIGDRFLVAVAVLGDFVAADNPFNPEEIRDSERPTKLRLTRPDLDVKNNMTIGETVRDIVLGGGGYIVKDVKFVVN